MKMTQWTANKFTRMRKLKVDPGICAYFNYLPDPDFWIELSEYMDSMADVRRIA